MVKSTSKRNYKYSELNTQEYSKLEFIDQNPIGKSSRSNPVTYIKAYDDIRNLFSKQKLSVLRNYKSGYFSLMLMEGDVIHFKGEGVTTVEIVYVRCTFNL